MSTKTTENTAEKSASSPTKRTTGTTKRATTATRKRRTAKTPAPVTPGEAPAPIIPVTEPGQFGRVNVMDITPNEEHGVYPARVELGEAFEVTAQVFIEGRTKVGATAVVRNPRGKEMLRAPMTCVNPGLDRWTVTLTCGEHSDAKPWEPEFAKVKRQLGEWTVTVEGWEDTYISWLHDATIKVQVGDDVENALISGSQLLARWASSSDAKLNAHQRKTLEAAAATMADASLSPQERLAAATSSDVS